MEPEQDSFRLSEIISALSYDLDPTEGQPMGHAVKSCALSMKIAKQLGLSGPERADLFYYALLLKAAGCSSNASRMYRIIGGDASHSLDAECFAALRLWIDEKGWNPSLSALGQVGESVAVAPAIVEGRVF